MPEQVTPYKSAGENKKQQVARMFNNIAHRYDFLNHFLSLGIDRSWRKAAIQQLQVEQPKVILDIATGTADLAIEAMRLKPVKIFGIDISVDMLELGKKKIKSRQHSDVIELLEGDSENLIFEDNKFDAVTVAFGVRNFEHLQKGLQELYRVLKPGGKLVVLEFSHPKQPLMRSLYKFYNSRITPFFGKIISKDAAAYTYLNESIQAFPSGEAFLTELKKVGFIETTAKTMTFGIVSIYCGKKA